MHTKGQLQRRPSELVETCAVDHRALYLDGRIIWQGPADATSFMVMTAVCEALGVRFRTFDVDDEWFEQDEAFPDCLDDVKPANAADTNFCGTQASGSLDVRAVSSSQE